MTDTDDTIQKIADEMRDLAQTSDDCQYGTISTDYVRRWAGRIDALSARASAGEGGLDGLNFDPDERHQVADMANVGYALMQTIARNLPGYVWNECPSEIVCDLMNLRGEILTAAPQPAQTQGEECECKGTGYLGHRLPNGDYESDTWVCPKHPTSQPAAAHGWVMVPMEPTPEMLRAGFLTEVEGFGLDSPNDSPGIVYRAMLAAAPQPQTFKSASESCKSEPEAQGAVLDKPARVGATVFSAGVPCRLVIDRAQREQEWHENPPLPNADMAGLRKLLGAPPAHGDGEVEPVFHLRSYGDVSASDLEAVTTRPATTAEPAGVDDRWVRAWRNQFVSERTGTYQRYHGDSYELARARAETDANMFADAFAEALSLRA